MTLYATSESMDQIVKRIEAQKQKDLEAQHGMQGRIDAYQRAYNRLRAWMEPTETDPALAEPTTVVAIICRHCHRHIRQERRTGAFAIPGQDLAESHDGICDDCYETIPDPGPRPTFPQDPGAPSTLSQVVPGEGSRAQREDTK